MGWTRSVGWTVGWLADARGPIDHASVGLAQAHPNYIHNYLHHKCLNLPCVELLWNFAIHLRLQFYFIPDTNALQFTSLFWANHSNSNILIPTLQFQHFNSNALAAVEAKLTQVVNPYYGHNPTNQKCNCEYKFGMLAWRKVLVCYFIEGVRVTATYNHNYNETYELSVRIYQVINSSTLIVLVLVGIRRPVCGVDVSELLMNICYVDHVLSE